MEDPIATRAFLLNHWNDYPKLQMQDIFKALYQSTFGCGHLIADSSAVAEYIRKEAATCVDLGEPFVEPLDGDYCRVHLACLRHGVTVEALARFFTLSAEMSKGKKEYLEQKLAVLLEMTAKGELPFDTKQTEREIAAWREASFPPLHHSEAFRKAYSPAYRVVLKRFGTQLMAVTSMIRSAPDASKD